MTQGRGRRKSHTATSCRSRVQCKTPSYDDRITVESRTHHCFADQAIGGIVTGRTTVDRSRSANLRYWTSKSATRRPGSMEHWEKIFSHGRQGAAFILRQTPAHTLDSTPSRSEIRTYSRRLQQRRRILKKRVRGYGHR